MFFTYRRIKYLFKNDFTRVRKLQKLANSRHFLSQKLQKIGTGPRVSFLNLVVYLLDYHLPLMVVLDRFEVVKKIELKIDHKLKKSNVPSNRCYGSPKLLFAFLFQKFILLITKPYYMTVATLLYHKIINSLLPGGFFSSFWPVLGKIRIVYCLVTMATDNLRLLIFEVQ